MGARRATDILAAQDARRVRVPGSNATQIVIWSLAVSGFQSACAAPGDRLTTATSTANAPRGKGPWSPPRSVWTPRRCGVLYAMLMDKVRYHTLRNRCRLDGP